MNSIQDLVKKEDAYSRKRKNMIAHSVLLEKLRNSSCENGVSKRLARCAEGGETANTSSLMVGGGLPPLHRNGRRVLSDGSLDSSRGVYRSPWRSLSLSDLQHVSGVPGLVSSKRDELVYLFFYQKKKKKKKSLWCYSFCEVFFMVSLFSTYAYCSCLLVISYGIRACLEIIGYQAGCSFALYPVVDKYEKKTLASLFYFLIPKVHCMPIFFQIFVIVQQC